MTQATAKEIMSAYADCQLDPARLDFNADEWLAAARKRQLDYRSGEWVTPAEAAMVLKAALPDGYNAFHAGLLEHLPERCRVQVARELSVCLYVDTIRVRPEEMKAAVREMAPDEVTMPTADVWRLWWD